MSDSSPRRRARTAAAALAVLAVALLIALLPWSPAAAASGEHSPGIDVVLDVQRDGTLHVTETIQWDFGSASGRHGIYRYLPTKVSYDADRNRVYPLDNVSAASPTGADATVDVTDADISTIRIGSESETVQGRQTYVIRYDLGGVVNTTDAGQELYWNAVGTEWEVPFDRAAVTVKGPAGITRATCFQGRDGANTPCAAANVSGQQATFTSAGGLGVNEGLTVVAGFPADTFTQTAPLLKDKWKVTKAFEVTPSTGLASVGAIALLAGGTALVVARRGRDRRYVDVVPGLTPLASPQGAAPRTERVGRRTGPVAVQFTPPKGLRAGEAGTLIDERADVVDVTATIVDLAVRGFLRIEEVRDAGDDPGEPASDWALVTLGRNRGELRAYEQELLERLFSGHGDRVQLSELKTTFSSDLSHVRSMLADHVADQGWFTANPHTVRARWAGLGWAVVGLSIALTVVLAIWTRWALVGVAFVVAGVLVVVLGRRMPARTASGSALLTQVQGFRLYLETAEADQIRFEEQQDVFSRYLPYAIVFGVAERWSRVFAQLAATGVPLATPDWYVGYYAWGPGGFDYHGFSGSLQAFSSQTASSLSEGTPSSSGSSGFSGGFSGGGGGGGGGGSW